MSEIKKDAVDSLSQKLEAFSEGLPEQEQNVLEWLMSCARTASESELSESALESVSGGDVSATVTWSKKSAPAPAQPINTTGTD